MTPILGKITQIILLRLKTKIYLIEDFHFLEER